MADALNASHSYLDLPGLCYQRCSPTAVKAPQWVAFNQSLASTLNIPQDFWFTDQGLQLFSGNQLPQWSQPVSQAYAGHQFGHFNPRLGDGRAILLAELNTSDGQRFDIQLKGAGVTPYSRGGDGRSPLGPVIREYIVSEAMHNLGIPTTRALAAVVTGEAAYREQAEPGAILTRAASSHLRIGSVQFVRAHGSVDDLKALADFALERHYAHLINAKTPYLELLKAIIARQLELVAHWMSIGFIHGVMNTDNTSLSGETIDYGPCALMENYRAEQVFSFIDKRGRYAYNRQPGIIQWNLTRLAESLLPLLEQENKEAVAQVAVILEQIPQQFAALWQQTMSRKLGLTNPDAADTRLIQQLLAGFEQGSIDFTLGFRQLNKELTNLTTPQPIYHSMPHFTEWRDAWHKRLQQEAASDDHIRQQMDQVNPLRIPRNHRVQAVIDAAYQHGDLRPFQRLQAALASPYEEDEQFSDYTQPAAADETVTTTFCGT